MGVSVGGIGVGVATGAPHPTKNNVTHVTPMICGSKFWQLIFDSFRVQAGQRPSTIFCCSPAAEDPNDSHKHVLLEKIPGLASFPWSL
jgi:hypothetical protein